MAIVAFSADIQDMRGKIGSNVFSKARNGSTVRIRVSPRNPKSTAQSAVRLNLAKASAAYKGLAAAQLTAWAAYAAGQTKHNAVTGKAYVPTANTVFVGLSSKFLQVNPAGTIPVTPPSAPFAGDTIAVTAAGAAGKVTFAATAANTSGVKTEVLLQALKSKARTPTAKGYRSKVFNAYVAGSLSLDVLVPAGSYAPAYRFVNTATGQETGMVTLAIVTVT